MFVLELLPSRKVLIFNTRFNVKMKSLIETKLYMDGSLKHLKKNMDPIAEKFKMDINRGHKTQWNQRLPGACNRSPGSKLLSITTQLHCGGHLGGRAQLPDTILEEDHPMTIPSNFGFN